MHYSFIIHYQLCRSEKGERKRRKKKGEILISVLSLTLMQHFNSKQIVSVCVLKDCIPYYFTALQKANRLQNSGNFQRKEKERDREREINLQQYCTFLTFGFFKSTFFITSFSTFSFQFVQFILLHIVLLLNHTGVHALLLNQLFMCPLLNRLSLLNHHNGISIQNR